MYVYKYVYIQGPGLSGVGAGLKQSGKTCAQLYNHEHANEVHITEAHVFSLAERLA